MIGSATRPEEPKRSRKTVTLFFVSDSRYRSPDGTSFERRRWATPVTQYRVFNGRRVASEAEARWTLPAGEFAYARFELVDAEYNLPAAPSC